MPDIAYYISSHGYGHAAREQAVIDQLSKHSINIHVRTATPEKFFKSATSYHKKRYDIGMIQSDALHFDIPASLQWMAEFLTEQESIITDELAFIREQNIQLIVSDMPPIACEIAARAGIPSVVVTHFTWDWVYAHYTDAYPQYQYIVEHIRQQYNKATLALQMQVPIPHKFDMFPTVEPVGLVYNPATKSSETVRAEFDIPVEMPMVLLSMGGHAWGNSNIQTLKAFEDAIFLVMPGAWEQVKDSPERFRKVPVEYDDYHNLIVAADVLVGKAGGSTVAEIIGHRTPMIYTTQGADQWRETQLLTKTLETYASAQYVPMSDFMAGNWLDVLPDMLDREHHWKDVNRDGASTIALRLLDMF